MAEEMHVGIDVSKATLDVAVGAEGDFWQVKNNSKGIEKLVERLGAVKPALVMLESTGGYEQQSAHALRGDIFYCTPWLAGPYFSRRDKNTIK